MSVAAEKIKQLREQTGAGVKDCRDALEKSGGDLEKAAELLRAQGLAAASQRAERETRNGVLELYRHGEGRVGVMVEVNCETDFVGRTKEFREFAHEMALQVAAASPRWVSPGEIPAAALEHQAEEARRVGRADGKPEAVIEKIVAGRLEKLERHHPAVRPLGGRRDDRVSQRANPSVGPFSFAAAAAAEGG
ncbi:MAG: elongation factor Ts [Anaerolineales bacterium]|nr:elongation factor Ts [Anaerolineales bacterium]